MGIFGNKSIVGVEIDAYGISAVEMGGTATAPKLLRTGKKALPADAVKDGKLLKPAVLTQVLTSLWQEFNISTREVILGVNNQDVLVRFANFPKVPQNRIDTMIRFQAQAFLPIPVNDVELDYVIIGEEKQGDTIQIKVLLIAARKNMIYDFMDAFEAANLMIRDIDMSTLAIARLLPAEAEKGVCAIINIGYEQTNILILAASRPHLARSLMTSQTNTEDPEAEKNAFSVRIKPDGLSQENIERFFSPIAGEISNSINYFHSQRPGANVEKLYLCGYGSKNRNIAQLLKDYTGLTVEVINPYRGIELAAVKNKIDVDEAVDFSVSVSLALGGLGVR